MERGREGRRAKSDPRGGAKPRDGEGGGVQEAAGREQIVSVCSAEGREG